MSYSYKPLSTNDKLEISSYLEDYHAVFFTFFEMANIYFTNRIPTAAVKFEKSHKPDLMLNEDFWNRHNRRGKLFIICHECLHVMLDHGTRNGLSVPGATPRLVNVAQDITINEMIVDLFNYDRNDLQNWKKYCWIDTCFEHPATIARHQTFTYYLEKLITDPASKDDKDDGLPETLDDHNVSPGEESPPDLFDNHPMNNAGEIDETQEQKERREKVAKTLSEDLDPNEIEQIIKALPEGAVPLAGTMAGAYEMIIAKKICVTKLNFKKIVAKLKRTCIVEIPKDYESFARDDRRLSDVITRSGGILPGKIESSRPDKDRLLTACFMDVSGSCMEYFSVFEKIFLAFDAERKTFETRLFTFDTSVKEIKPGDVIFAGGGTNFHIIEEKCLQLQTEIGRYPDCVVVITDGQGSVVSPKAPSKWIWLLTPFSSQSFIPSASKRWPIKEVIF